MRWALITLALLALLATLVVLLRLTTDEQSARPNNDPRASHRGDADSAAEDDENDIRPPRPDPALPWDSGSAASEERPLGVQILLRLDEHGAVAVGRQETTGAELPKNPFAVAPADTHLAVIEDQHGRELARVPLRMRDRLYFDVPDDDGSISGGALEAGQTISLRYQVPAEDARLRLYRLDVEHRLLRTEQLVLGELREPQRLQLRR